MIRVRNLSVRYGSVTALEGLDLYVECGSCLLVTGPSGFGKSTLARALIGLIPHAIPATWEGEAIVADLNIHRHSIPEIAQRVGAVFQNPSSQLFHLRAEDEVAFGPRNYRCFDSQVHEQTLAESDLLELRCRRPTALFVGQLQRTALGACLSLRPNLLILDEPTLGKDWGHLERLMDYLVDLNRQGEHR
jgi:energy-coupling factor transporter ATP-binding protein EcfA2